MVLMSLVGLAVGVSFWKGVSAVAEEHGKKAYPQLDRRNYDLDNGVKGISFNGETNIRKIAARNGVLLVINPVLNTLANTPMALMM